MTKRSFLVAGGILALSFVRSSGAVVAAPNPAGDPQLRDGSDVCLPKANPGESYSDDWRCAHVAVHYRLDAVVPSPPANARAALVSSGIPVSIVYGNATARGPPAQSWSWG